MKYIITENQIRGFERFLYQNERSRGTVEKYLRDLTSFRRFLGEQSVSKERVALWKEELVRNGYAASTVNSMLTAVHCFLRFAGWQECCVRLLRRQRTVFCDEEKELTREEYLRLLRTAGKQGNQRLCLVMQTICSTGIRVSELKFISVSSLSAGRAEVDCKGKRRVILLAPKLCLMLKAYCRQQNIRTGPVFTTKNGKALDRSNIWREMKRLCEQAGVEPSKVFPHNLRHLFARIFYRMEKDISKLADLLGHASIETTRIYIMESGLEHGRKVEQLGLLL